mgnify:CR=1 FL=1
MIWPVLLLSAPFVRVLVNLNTKRVLTGVCLFAYNRGNYASRAAVAPVFTEINTLPCAEIQTAVSYGYAETHA